MRFLSSNNFNPFITNNAPSLLVSSGCEKIRRGVGTIFTMHAFSAVCILNLLVFYYYCTTYPSNPTSHLREQKDTNKALSSRRCKYHLSYLGSCRSQRNHENQRTIKSLLTFYFSENSEYFLDLEKMFPRSRKIKGHRKSRKHSIS